MIETLWEFVRAVMLVLAMLAIVAVTVYLLSSLSDSPHRTQLEQRESQYRAACEETKGRTVWNGSHWECLK